MSILTTNGHTTCRIDGCHLRTNLPRELLLEVALRTKEVQGTGSVQTTHQIILKRAAKMPS